MYWLILVSSVCLVFGSHASVLSQNVDFDSMELDDIFDQSQLKRVQRAPDYGAGVGGPLAASGWTPPSNHGEKPAPKPASKPSPAAPPASKPPAGGPTAPPKKPEKDMNSGSGAGANGKDGEDIATALYNHPNECHDPADGGIWAPLPKGQPCGSDGNCPYPQKWCSAKQGGGSNPSLSCQALPPECQKAISADSAATTAAAPAPPAMEPETTQAPATSMATTKATTPSTKKTTKATQASTAAAASPAAPGGPKTSGDCQDKHPFCCFWADDKQHPSECDRNTAWMKSMCPKSCGTCGCTSGNCPTKVNTEGCKWLPGGGGGAAPGGKTTIFIGGQPPAGNPAGNGFGPVAPAGNGVAPSAGNAAQGGTPGLTRITFG